jgi:TonB family protein
VDKSILLPILLFLIVTPVAQPSGLPQSSMAARTTQTVPASAAGFQTQLDAAVDAYRAGDLANGRRFLEQFRLSNSAQWFAEHLGSERSGQLTQRYDRIFSNFENSLEKSILDVLRNGGANLVTSLEEGREKVPTPMAPNAVPSGVTAIKMPSLYYCQFSIKLDGRENVSWGDAFTYEDRAFRFVGFGSPPFWVWKDGTEGRAPEGGSFIRPAVLISTVKQVYPANARLRGIHGVVTVHFWINEKGQVDNVTVINGDPSLTQAAIDAVRQYRFNPATMGGISIPSDSSASLEFAPDVLTSFRNWPWLVMALYLAAVAVLCVFYLYRSRKRKSQIPQN